MAMHPCIIITTMKPTRLTMILSLVLTLGFVAVVGCEPLREPRGYRYCEILVVYEDTSVVWGTQGLNNCPAAQWEALVPDALRADHGARGIIMNGPRQFVVDGVSGVKMPAGDTEFFGDLEMRRIAVLQATDPVPYVPETIHRTNVWTFNAGSEIYALYDPKGQVYVMQSFSQGVDPTLEASALSALGDRLTLPPGWRFVARVLEEEMQLVATGEAVVVTDDLRNTYQRR